MYCTAVAFLGKCVFLQDFSSAMSNLANHGEGAVNMNSKEQNILANTGKIIGKAKERTGLSSELEQDLENLGLQRRMKQLDLENKLLKKQNNELG